MVSSVQAWLRPLRGCNQCIAHGRLLSWGRICFQAYEAAGIIQLPVGSWTEGLSCLWALIQRLPQLLARGPLHRPAQQNNLRLQSQEVTEFPSKGMVQIKAEHDSTSVTGTSMSQLLPSPQYLNASRTSWFMVHTHTFLIIFWFCYESWACLPFLMKSVRGYLCVYVGEQVGG